MIYLSPEGRRTFAILAAAVIGGSLVLVSATLASHQLGDDGWADLTKWIEALSTLSAFIAAGVAAAYAARVFRIETRREDRWHETQQREQAALVAAWVTETWTGSERAGEVRRPYAGPVFVMVRNASQVPVTDVMVAVTIEVPTPRAEPRRFQLPTVEVAVIPPGDVPESVTVSSADHARVYLDDLGWHESQGPEVAATVVIRFTDAAGVHWVRGHGRLWSTRRPVDLSLSRPA